MTGVVSPEIIKAYSIYLLESSSICSPELWQWPNDDGLVLTELWVHLLNSWMFWIVALLWTTLLCERDIPEMTKLQKYKWYRDWWMKTILELGEEKLTINVPGRTLPSTKWKLILCPSTGTLLFRSDWRFIFLQQSQVERHWMEVYCVYVTYLLERFRCFRIIKYNELWLTWDFEKCLPQINLYF